MPLRRIFPFARPEPERAFIDVIHGGETYRVALRRSASARRFTLRVRAGPRDVVLTVPARARWGEVRSFAERHAAWVDLKLRQLPRSTPFEPGVLIPLRGEPHLVALSPLPRGKGPVMRAPPSPEGGPARLFVGGEPAFAARRLRDFLTKEARRDLESAVARHAARLGVTPRRISIRDTATRWGSCSAAGALNFSWRLILAPPPVLDYLAAHEVAHLVHMNHSKAFWNVVAGLDPAYEEAEAWLRREGRGLLRFGVAEGAG
ncbi:M48 family metallopeptidase [Methylocella sp.]|uniref:M48 family metallopeptidase n=1 Tax=Methylocella sp. TaxID=1978226 RepID=UPI00378405A0